MLVPFKNRTLDPLKPVDVYRCLNRKGRIFSVRQDGYVVAHGNNFILNNVLFKINKAGKDRAIKTGNRNVHSYARGIIQDKVNLSFGINLYYNPFCVIGFYHTFEGKVTVVQDWDVVSFNSNGVFLN